MNNKEYIECDSCNNVFDAEEVTLLIDGLHLCDDCLNDYNEDRFD